MPRWPKRTERAGMDEYGRTSLWNYCFKGEIEAVEKELISGADPNKGDDEGYTPLHIAIQERHVEIIKLLLANGADINQPDKHGNVPFWTAIHNWQQKYDIIILLLNAGADPRVENNYGNSAMSVLVNSDNEEIKSILKKRFPNEYDA